MKVFVTGAGLVGSQVARHFGRLGHEVWVLSRFLSGRKPLFEGFPRVTPWATDLRGQLNLGGLPSHFDLCVATAADLAVGSEAEAAGAQKILENTLLICELKNVPKLIYFSSASVAKGFGRHLVSEQADLDLSTHYKKMKAQDELVLLGSAGLTVTVFRLTAPIGIDLPPDRFLRRLIESSLRGQTLLVYPDGTRRQNYVDTRDIARATQFAAEAGLTGLYNLSGNRTISNLELANMVVETVKSTSYIQFGEFQDVESGRNFEVSNVKLRRAGFDCVFSIKRSIDWIAKNLRATLD